MTGYMSNMFGNTFSFGIPSSDDKMIRSIIFQVLLKNVTMLNDEGYRYISFE